LSIILLTDKFILSNTTQLLIKNDIILSLEEHLNKTININTTIFELVSMYPEIKDIMKSLGFDSIVNPVMLKTAGRVMTIKTGSQMKKIDINLIKERFLEHNFILEENNE